MKFDSEQYAKFAELGNEIGKKIDRASKFYNALIEAGNVPMSDENRLHTGTMYSYLDELNHGVEIRWETSWRYGGHDQGSCFYSIEDLLDDTWEKSIIERAEEAVKEYRGKKKKEEKQNEKAERIKYERLKEKFEK